MRSSSVDPPPAPRAGRATPPRGPQGSLRRARRHAGAWLGALLIAGSFSLTVSAANEADDATAELKVIRARIQALDGRLNETRMTRDEIALELRRSEREVGNITHKLRDIDSELTAKRRELERLAADKDNQLSALEGQRQALTRQIRASFATGQQDTLRVLLNQDDPATLARTLTYHRYFTRARSRRIEGIQSRLARLERLKEAIEADTRALKTLQSQQSVARVELERGRAQRGEALARLDNELRDGTERLRRLKQDENKLQELIAGLSRELEDIPTTLDESVPFSTLRGRLAWPSKGSIQRRFGARRQPGNMKWQGVIIGAPSGQPVHAVAHGRVAYADWLRGFGLITIIDHGDGYMSLYGQSQSLFKETGDWVQAGDVIAAVGDSGGNSDAGLYFEIRHKGAPVNPVRWLASR